VSKLSEYSSVNCLSGSAICPSSISINNLGNEILSAMDDQIDGSRLINNTVTNDKINGVNFNKISNVLILNDMIPTDEISGNKIQSNSIHGDRISNNSIDTQHVIDNSISHKQISKPSVLIEDVICNDSISNSSATLTRNLINHQGILVEYIEGNIQVNGNLNSLILYCNNTFLSQPLTSSTICRLSYYFDDLAGNIAFANVWYSGNAVTISRIGNTTDPSTGINFICERQMGTGSIDLNSRTLTPVS
jgi:hypothetical protein